MILNPQNQLYIYRIGTVRRYELHQNQPHGHGTQLRPAKTLKYMARPNLDLIAALRRTAQKIQHGAPYQWGHMGSCNCGNLAQEITKLTKAEIHAHALANGRGDWNEQLNDYCPTSGLPMDLLISEMIEAGLGADDLKHLERLSDVRVLQRLPEGKRYLRHNFRDDVVLYIRKWADLLEEQLLAPIQLPRLAYLSEMSVS